jgi:hypothetical protein
MGNEVRLTSPNGEYYTIYDVSLPINKFILTVMDGQAKAQQRKLSDIINKPIKKEEKEG